MSHAEHHPQHNGGHQWRLAAPAEPQALLAERMNLAPYQTIGIALGIGVVLGAGMWRLLARSLFEVGARAFIAAAPTLIETSPSSRPPA